MKTGTVRKNGCGTLILFLMISLTAICHGRIIMVDDDAPADFNNIQAAINAFAEGDSIVVADGNYIGQGNRDIIDSTDPNVKNLVIRSANGPEKCIIDCQSNGRALSFNNRNLQQAILDGLTIKNGKIIGKGGGIVCGYKTCPTIMNCIIMNNWATDDGGGIHCYQSNSIITNCLFYGNKAGEHGGGIYVLFHRTKIANCIFKNNSAYRGGGILYQSIQQISADADISNCTFFKNSAYASGSGIGCQASMGYNMIITNCNFIANSGTLTYSRSAVDVYWSTVTMKNCILWNNSGYHVGVTNSECPSTFTISYTNLQNGQSSISTKPRCTLNWGTGNIDSEPYFVDANNNDFHLLWNSPCINAGDPNYVAEVNEIDLDGKPRVIGGRIDMGAYEFDSRPIADAGPDKIVYAYIDDIADVNLDGSDSNDSDGDELTYKWTWAIDGNTYEANGVNPEIELPVGMHTIELIVNDGLENSLPDYVDVNVITPVKGSVKITPQAINLASRGNWIKATMILPEGFKVEDVDANVPIVVEPMGVLSKNSAWASFFAKEFKATKDRKAYPTNCLEALFDRGELCSGLDNGNQELSVVGQFKSGQYFYGSDIVKVIGKKKSAWAD